MTCLAFLVYIQTITQKMPKMILPQIFTFPQLDAIMSRRAEMKPLS